MSRFISVCTVKPVFSRTFNGLRKSVHITQVPTMSRFIQYVQSNLFSGTFNGLRKSVHITQVPTNVQVFSVRMVKPVFSRHSMD